MLSNVLLIALPLPVYLLKIYSVFTILPIIIFVILFTNYVKKKINGITGDIIGAIIELSEIIFLLSFIVSYSVML